MGLALCSGVSSSLVGARCLATPQTPLRSGHARAGGAPERPRDRAHDLRNDDDVSVDRRIPIADQALSQEASAAYQLRLFAGTDESDSVRGDSSGSAFLRARQFTVRDFVVLF